MDSNFRIINPAAHPLAAQVRIPGSKSHTNRALMLSALASGITTLKNSLFSDDTILFANALRELGFIVVMDPESSTITVNGEGGRIPSNGADLFVGNAGTAARFLTALLTLGKGSYRLDGTERMRQRPIGDLISALNELGAQVSPITPNPEMNIAPPLKVRANGLPGGKTMVRGDVSSQYLSALLMIAPLARKPVEISVEGALSSRPYIDLTLLVMEDFNVIVHRQGFHRFEISPQQYDSPGSYEIEADASSASYFFAAPAICGGSIEVENVSQDVRQGDFRFLSILAEMGCQVTYLKEGTRVVGPDRLVGVEVNLADISDTAMTLAVVAPFATSPTTIKGIASSRQKETDRIAAICKELSRLGVGVEERWDGLKIYPCEDFIPVRINTYDDHRIAMAFSLVGLRIPGIEIENPGCVSKTFPNFFDLLNLL
jgi:3-phosphoshikimate 1-carboxyvinyltransferase